jgi:hypothetical protein
LLLPAESPLPVDSLLALLQSPLAPPPPLSPPDELVPALVAFESCESLKLDDALSEDPACRPAGVASAPLAPP